LGHEVRLDRNEPSMFSTSWLATMNNDLSSHSLSVEDATELALDRPLWRLLTASGAMHWIGASRTMMMSLF